MNNYKSEFLRYLDREGIKYRDEDDLRVSIGYSGDNTNNIKVLVIFDSDGDGLVALRCWSFGKVSARKNDEMLKLCNKLNTQYRWVKFYIDNDNDLSLSIDAVIDIDTVGPECLQLVRRMVNIYDDAYNELMKVNWSNP